MSSSVVCKSADMIRVVGIFTLGNSRWAVALLYRRSSGGNFICAMIVSAGKGSSGVSEE